MPELHKVKIATNVIVGRAELYVVECVCGWSSALHQSKVAANEAYADHKRGLTSASFLPAFATDGTHEIL